MLIRYLWVSLITSFGLSAGWVGFTISSNEVLLTSPVIAEWISPDWSSSNTFRSLYIKKSGLLLVKFFFYFLQALCPKSYYWCSSYWEFEKAHQVMPLHASPLSDNKHHDLWSILLQQKMFNFSSLAGHTWIAISWSQILSIMWNHLEKLGLQGLHFISRHPKVEHIVVWIVLCI